MTQMTVAECVAHGGHCWQGTDMVLTSSPPQHPEYCKHCPARRRKIARDPWDYIDDTPKEHLA